MERSERVETDPFVENIVPVPEGDEQFAEVEGELPQDQGLDGQAGPGMPLEAEDGHDGPPPQGTAGVDAHQGQATGNGHVAAASEPLRAPCRESRKLAPRNLLRTRSPRLRFPRNLCL